MSILENLRPKIIKFDVSDMHSLVYLTSPDTKSYAYLTKVELEQLIQELTELKDKMI